MATANLRFLLHDLWRDLETWDAKNNKILTHTLFLEVDDLTSEVFTQFQRKKKLKRAPRPDPNKPDSTTFGKFNKLTLTAKEVSLKPAVEQAAQKFLDDVWNAAVAEGPSKVIPGDRGQTFIQVTFFIRMSSSGKGPADIYAFMGKVIETPLKHFTDQLKNILGKTIQFDKSHLFDSINKVLSNTLATIEKEINKAKKGSADKRILKELKADLDAILTVKKDLTTQQMFMTMGSRGLNRSAGSYKNKLRGQFKKAVLKKMPEAWFTSGSDSLMEGLRKDHINAIIEPFIISIKKNKNGKVTPRNKLKYKQAKSAASTKVSFKPKVKQAKGKTRIRRSAKTGRFISRRQASAQERGFNKAISPLALIKTLNAQLPAAVAQNMGSPRLNFRTGRFANSVRVTDIGQTKVGQSIGYTYQTNPYQVFEMGKGRDPWSTPDRDPRPLIDMSIREIMTQYTTKRFTTRRVM